MEMHQIRYFLALCHELNFTKAAERCHVSQPSLTRAVKLLEQELGGALLVRERANTHLTELGKMMYPHLAEILSRADAAKQQAGVHTKGMRARLRLGVLCTIAPGPIVALVEAMAKRHPDTDLDIMDLKAKDLEAGLLDGDLDVAVYCWPDRSNERLHRVALFQERMMIVLHPEHAFSTRPVLSFADVSEERYINRLNCEFNGAAAWRDSGVTWKAVYRSERDDWILAMVAAGMGFGFLPEHSITHAGVVAVPVGDPPLMRNVDIVTVRGHRYTPAVGAVVREARRVDWTKAGGRGHRQTESQDKKVKPAADGAK